VTSGIELQAACVEVPAAEAVETREGVEMIESEAEPPPSDGDTSSAESVNAEAQGTSVAQETSDVAFQALDAPDAEERVEMVEAFAAPALEQADDDVEAANCEETNEVDSTKDWYVAGKVEERRQVAEFSETETAEVDESAGMEQAGGSIEESPKRVDAEFKLAEPTQMDGAKDAQKANDFTEDEEVSRAKDHADCAELGMRAAEGTSEAPGLKRHFTSALTEEVAAEAALSQDAKRPKVGPEDAEEASGGVCQEEAWEVRCKDI